MRRLSSVSGLEAPKLLSPPGLSVVALLALALLACGGADESPVAAAPDATLDATLEAVGDAAPDVPGDGQTPDGEEGGDGDGSEDHHAQDLLGLDLTPEDGLFTADPYGEECDPLMPSGCALPWPSNRFLVDDATTVTGHRLEFSEHSLPSNIQGGFMKASLFDRLDGYGVGTSVIVHFPGLSLVGLPRETSIKESMEPACPVGLFKVGEDGLERIPFFVEPDDHHETLDRRALFVRPAVLLEEATRYVVAFRSLLDENGALLEPSSAFAALRDGVAQGLLAERAARFEEVFSLLDDAGMPRHDLTLAWDFVTASSEAMHGDLLHMRDRAFELAGPSGPELSITSVEAYTVEENEHIALSMEGTFSAPVFVEPLDGGQPVKWSMPRDEDGKPQHVGSEDFKVWIRVPHLALEGAPMGLMQYGHGLNGEGSQVKGSFNSKIAQDYGYIFFACDWEGMSEKDVPYITYMLADASEFLYMSNRLHQGMINPLLLARSMRERLPQHEEITSRGIQIDTTRLHYSGISQGGIYGATYMALTQDVLRGHLGVPGQNYSLLMPRSIDFTPFFAVTKLVYTDSLDRAVLLNALQSLWDSVDPSSHYRHIKAEPFPNTPPHEVLLASATGDYQVALLSNEITVRSDIGVVLLQDYGKPVDGVVETPYPHVGSGLVNYSFGNPWAEMTNLPPVQDELGDPHGKPRKLLHHMQQKVHFLETGEIIDVCGGDGCTPE
jgi:hypothetical protein